MVSVCISTYNGEKYIRRQVESILIQLSEDDEVVISDDNSTDSTVEILHSFNDTRIKIIKNQTDFLQKYTYEKITENFENAITNTKGNLIFLSDQDDVWHENKVALAKAKIGDNLALIHDCRVVDENGSEIYPSYFQHIKAKRGVIANIIKCSYLGCCMVLNRDILQKAMPFPKKVPHDLWLALIAEKLNSLIIINNKLIDYHRHSESSSTSAFKSDKSIWFKLFYRYHIIFELIKRFLKSN
ncbi:MAG: glycosyltransferase [Prevotellaceae bacterium]|jgi:glycosyltransferase involved in cell wall biosynthesis|nr:glycosyltransferase [Prevotellaceae bacterium]